MTSDPQVRKEVAVPIYEYRCPVCNKRSSRIWLRLPDAGDERALACPACGATGLSRLMSRFSSPKSEERRLDSLAEDNSLAGLDEDDPQGMARLMRRMSEETGEPLEGEDAEMLERMEAGEMPADEEGGASATGGGEDL
jgi:putative FmdB family regulatory protein